MEKYSEEELIRTHGIRSCSVLLDKFYVDYLTNENFVPERVADKSTASDSWVNTDQSSSGVRCPLWEKLEILPSVAEEVKSRSSRMMQLVPQRPEGGQDFSSSSRCYLCPENFCRSEDLQAHLVFFHRVQNLCSNHGNEMPSPLLSDYCQSLGYLMTSCVTTRMSAYIPAGNLHPSSIPSGAHQSPRFCDGSCQCQNEPSFRKEELQSPCKELRFNPSLYRPSLRKEAFSEQVCEKDNQKGFLSTLEQEIQRLERLRQKAMQGEVPLSFNHPKCRNAGNEVLDVNVPRKVVGNSEIGSDERPIIRRRQRPTCSAVSCSTSPASPLEILSVSQEDNLKKRAKSTGKTQFACENCGKSFQHLFFLNRHRLNKKPCVKKSGHDVQKSFVCQTCGKSFNRRPNLNRHMSKKLPCSKITCAGKKSVPRPPCGKGFEYSYKRQRVVNGKRPFSAPGVAVNARKPLKAEGNMQKRPRSSKDNSSIGEFKMDAKKASRNSQPPQLENNHPKSQKTNLIPKSRFICSRCPEEFRTPKALQRHEKKHDVKLWRCLACNLLFQHRSGLTGHMVAHAKDLRSTRAQSQNRACKEEPSSAAVLDGENGCSLPLGPKEEGGQDHESASIPVSSAVAVLSFSADRSKNGNRSAPPAAAADLKVPCARDMTGVEKAVNI